MSREPEYEVIIVGGGPAGLTAGLYASRAKLKTLLVEKSFLGGPLVNTFWIENYPGFPEGISGAELAQKIEDQAKRFGLEVVFAKATGVELKGNEKLLKTTQGDYKTKTIIISAGTQPAKLGVPGEDKFYGRGVSYCAVCDAPFFKEKQVIVVGGGDSALEEALYLTKFARKVKVVHRRDQLRAVKLLQERAFQNEKIEFIWNSVIYEIEGEDKIKEVKVRNVKTGEIKGINADGVFVYIGSKPNTEFLRGVIELDSQGYIVTDENMATSLPGIFAAGDVRQKLLRQIVTAASDGAIAATAAAKYIESLK